jgi:aminoglycoside 2''-phosphotransferase
VSIWLSEGEIAAVCVALEKAAPAQVGREFRLLGEGFGSVALESAGGVVVLVAKNDVGRGSRAISLRLLPELRGRLDFETPFPVWHLEGSAGIPYGAFAYRKLPGVPVKDIPPGELSPELSDDVARFLSELHEFPAKRAIEVGVPSFERTRIDLQSLRDEVMPFLRARLSSGEYEAMDAWWDAFLTDADLLTPRPVLIHADLWPDNILLDPASGRLSAIIDFGDACLGDPAHDFATLSNLGKPFERACVEAYLRRGGDLGIHFEGRVARYRELRTGSFYSLRAALRVRDESVIADCLVQLRMGAILNPR